MKRNVAIWFFAVLLFVTPASSCLASNRHAVPMDDFIPAYQKCVAQYLFLGASWDADNFTLISQDKRIGFFDYDGLFMECELYKNPQRTGNSLRLLSVKVPLDTNVAPNAARPGTDYRIVALIATLENQANLSKADKRQDALSTAMDLYETMKDKYAVYADLSNEKSPLYRGQAYSYFYEYEDSAMPTYFVAEIVE